MALTRPPLTAADGTFSASGATNWNAGFGILGAISGGIPYFDSTTSEATSALLGASAIVMGGGVGAAPFTDITNFVRTASGSLGGGPTLQFGSGATTSVGWVWGSAASTFSGMWVNGVTPSLTNYFVISNNDNTDVRINGNTALKLQIGGSTVLGIDATTLRSSSSNRIFASTNAPTISSGFGGTPTIPASNGTFAFTVNVGTGGAASAGVIALPAAPTGWRLNVENMTGTAANRADQRTVQTATTTTTATVQNQTISTGAALAWTASDVLIISAMPY